MTEPHAGRVFSATSTRLERNEHFSPYSSTAPPTLIHLNHSGSTSPPHWVWSLTRAVSDYRPSLLTQLLPRSGPKHDAKYNLLVHVGFQLHTILESCKKEENHNTSCAHHE